MEKQLTPGQRRGLIKKLSAKRASSISFKNGYITLEFDGHSFRNRVRKKHDPTIGNWSRRHHEVHYDEHVTGRDVLPILVHETIEKYCTQHYGLHTQSEAHKVALAVEKKFIRNAKQWKIHEGRIQGWWLAENLKRNKIRKKSK